MPSPFPGMGPYLESSGLWQDLHHSLIYRAREALQPQLPPRYYALIEERIIFEALSRSYYPDVTIARQGAGTTSAGGVQGAPGSRAVVAVDMEADVAIEVEDEEEIRQGYLEIREVSGGRVASASSSLRSGVADFGHCWETAGHKEVSHEQEVRGAAVRGRADGL